MFIFKPAGKVQCACIYIYEKDGGTMNASSEVIKESSHRNFHRRLEINWTYF